ncbi:MAG: hypothetical protein MR687_10050 [Spirochaetales bacterium]|nr:hypothetical protein [Spirochaetales bacterium]
MRKLLIPLVIVLTLITVACAVADPNDIPVENEELTIKLDISKEINEEEITVNVALRVDDSFSINVPLTREESSKTYPAAITTYNVMVQESGSYDYEYPDSITIKAGEENILTIKVLPKSPGKDNPEKPIEPDNPEQPGEIEVPGKNTGNLLIDYCNVYGVPMHYEIYTYLGNTLVESKDIEGDYSIELDPGTYTIKARFTEEHSDFSLWEITRNGDSSDVKDSNFMVEIKKGENQLIGFYIKDNKVGAREYSQVVINTLYGKELLSPQNAYDHDVSVDYTIRYATGLPLMKKGTTYVDYNVVLEYDFVEMKAEFNIIAKDRISGEDVSNHYLIVPYWIYTNTDKLQGMTETKHINIYRGDVVEFNIEEELKENQSIIIYCEQFYQKSSYSIDGKLQIAYDIPFDISCSIITTDEKGNETSSYYCKYENLVFSEGDSTTITLKRNC